MCDVKARAHGDMRQKLHAAAGVFMGKGAGFFLDGKGRAQPETVIAKSARPSVLENLKRPVPPRSPEKKPKQHEQEVR